MSTILHQRLERWSCLRECRDDLKVVALLIAVLLGSQAMSLAEEKAPVPSNEASPIECSSPIDARVLNVLDEPMSFEFMEEPLEAVIGQMQDFYNITVRLDEKGLDDAGVSADTPIGLALKDMPLRSFLTLLRLKYDLYYLVQDGMLLITTRDVAQASENLVRKVYPVGDLVPGADYKDLLEAITTTVEPTSWSKVGGNGSAVALNSSKSLVIAQTREAHDSILQLLRSLRAAHRAAPLTPARS